jgi:hypothetical protein
MLAIYDCYWISFAVALVLSKLSISYLLSKIVAGSASDNYFNKDD